MSKKKNKNNQSQKTLKAKTVVLQASILGFSIFMSSYLTRASIYSEHPELITDPQRVAVAAEPDVSSDAQSTVLGASDPIGPNPIIVKDSDVPVIFTEDDELQSQLVDFIKKYPACLDIVKNADAYEDPEKMFSFLMREPKAYEFVKNLPTAERIVTGGITDSEMEAEYPLFVQWDTRWGYMPYGGNIMATSGCAPTAVSMIAAALTGDKNISPDVVANYCMDKHLYVKGIGTSWNFFNYYTSEFGIKGKVVFPSEDNLIKAVNAGHPVLMSLGPGDFTDNGHIAVIVGYKDGKFEIRDPGSIERSQKLWDYYTLAKQLKGTWEFYRINDSRATESNGSPANTEPKAAETAPAPAESNGSVAPAPSANPVPNGSVAPAPSANPVPNGSVAPAPAPTQTAPAEPNVSNPASAPAPMQTEGPASNTEPSANNN